MLWNCSSSKFHVTLDIYVINKTRVSEETYNKRMEAEMHVLSNWTFRGPCIMIYSYNKNQQDTLFLNFILVKNSTCFRQIYCASAIGICHTSYVDCLLADSQHN